MSDFSVFLQRNQQMLTTAFLTHLRLSFVSVLIGICIAVPLGILLTRHRSVASRVLATVSVLQTIPSMVLFGLLMPILGIGSNTAMLVLVLYSILPILRNTYTGVSEVPPNYLEAATGMGMSSTQRLLRVELPLALPVIVTGIQLSSVYIISWATIAALIGGGGLGDLIYTGILTYNYKMIALGAVPASILAVLTSLVIGWISRIVTPKGMRR